MRISIGYQAAILSRHSINIIAKDRADFWTCPFWTVLFCPGAFASALSPFPGNTFHFVRRNINGGPSPIHLAAIYFVTVHLAVAHLTS